MTVSHVHTVQWKQVWPTSRASTDECQWIPDVYQMSILLSFVHIMPLLLNVKQELSALWHFSKLWTLRHDSQMRAISTHLRTAASPSPAFVPFTPCSGEECCKFRNLLYFGYFDISVIDRLTWHVAEMIRKISTYPSKCPFGTLCLCPLLDLY